MNIFKIRAFPKVTVQMTEANKKLLSCKSFKSGSFCPYGTNLVMCWVSNKGVKILRWTNHQIILCEYYSNNITWCFVLRIIFTGLTSPLKDKLSITFDILLIQFYFYLSITQLTEHTVKVVCHLIWVFWPKFLYPSVRFIVNIESASLQEKFVFVENYLYINLLLSSVPCNKNSFTKILRNNLLHSLHQIILN